MPTPPAIRLSPTDNVVVCCRDVAIGETFMIDAHPVVVGQAVPLGHKLALIPLAAGAKVVKYGMPIGSMTLAATAGDWIHLHNMKSDYMPVHLRDTEGDRA